MRTTYDFEPKINYTPTEQLIAKLASPFEKLSKTELQQEWAKELYIGLHFGNELDLYRAITAFKRALILLPQNHKDRKIQVEYYIFLCYYLGQKYQDALHYFQTSELDTVPLDFPAYKDLLISLYECYNKTEQFEKAQVILQKIESLDPETSQSLKLSSALREGNLKEIEEMASCANLTDPNPEEIQAFLQDYSSQALSPTKAKTLNALLPGAGYYYVGQKKAAATSLAINALFTWAAYAFIKKGYIAAGVVTASLESGWYLGGINGAGLAANEYNERLYETSAKEFMLDHALFPILKLEMSF
jgi:tetratricopeptide (TPR) repeat protein